MTHTSNAIELLRIIVRKRMWHDNKFLHNTAKSYKKRILEGRLPYETACEVLTTLGYVKVEEEKWTIKKPTD